MHEDSEVYQITKHAEKRTINYLHNQPENPCINLWGQLSEFGAVVQSEPVDVELKCKINFISLDIYKQAQKQHEKQ